jgi:hypothetical protein
MKTDFVPRPYATVQVSLLSSSCASWSSDAASGATRPERP